MSLLTYRTYKRCRVLDLSKSGEDLCSGVCVARDDASVLRSVVNSVVRTRHPSAGRALCRQDGSTEVQRERAGLNAAGQF